MRQHRLVGFVLAAFALWGIASLSWSTGRVVDATTGKPLEGVHVLAHWWGWIFKGVESSRVCVGNEGAATDATGEFRVSAWSGSLNPLVFGVGRSVQLYRRGYWQPQNSDRGDGTFIMEQDTRPREERLLAVAGMAATTASYGCGAGQREVFAPFLTAVKSELESAPPPLSHAERRALNGVTYYLDRFDLGDIKALEKYKQREREWGLLPPPAPVVTDRPSHLGGTRPPPGP